MIITIMIMITIITIMIMIIIIMMMVIRKGTLCLSPQCTHRPSSAPLYHRGVRLERSSIQGFVGMKLSSFLSSPILTTSMCHWAPLLFNKKIMMALMLPLRYPESWRGTACSLPRTGYLLPPFSSYRLRRMMMMMTMMMMMMILTIIMLGTWHIDPATFLDIEGGTDITESGKNDDDLNCDQHVFVLKKSDWMTVYYDNSGEINIEETISLVRIKSRSMH